MPQNRFRSLNTALQERFGEKIYKLSLNGGCTCPNRDGTLGTRGCIFCSAGGSGDFASSPALSITEQIEDAKKRLAGKRPVQRYIAYFQAYTNTYAPIEHLRMISQRPSPTRMWLYSLSPPARTVWDRTCWNCSMS